MKSFPSFILTLLLITIAQGCAPTTEQANFSSPEQAVDALVSAARDADTKRLNEIFGPEAKQVISSGDAVADNRARQQFLEKYDQKHELVGGSDGPTSIQLLVGNDDWPFPVPVVLHKGMWTFDTKSGAEEIINRRVGRNELAAEQVCKAIVDAQREYAIRDPDGNGIAEYAQKFISDPGTKNGLYFPTTGDEKPSPLGELVAQASEEGYQVKKGQRTPYRGYFYRVLMSQGPSAPGGAKDYVVNGLMIGGFAVVAWPAEYDSSGVVTFIVNQDGVVYEKDLGKNTDRIASAMTVFDPGDGWKLAD